jgi:hypothetical protein
MIAYHSPAILDQIGQWHGRTREAMHEEGLELPLEKMDQPCSHGQFCHISEGLGGRSSPIEE